MKQLVITADDFGAAVAVNLAVEQAHREGLLTAASLMVTGPAAADAVSRARAMPTLGVGLHLVLVDGRPVLPPARVPALVDRDGRFHANMVRAGINIFARPAARRQLAAEIDAQFAAFAATGFTLDHVNAHKHFHLHPTIAATVLEVGKRYGLRSVRAPVEPRRIIKAVEPSVSHGIDVANPWARLIRRRMQRNNMLVPDQVFGLAWSGGFDAARLRSVLQHLPDGLSEIYFHPATDDAYPGHAAGYRYREELAALLDDGARAACGGIERGRFADFAGTPG